MFPSAGYFRSANCPFFIHGLCHRPYCHFRHAKPGHGSGSKPLVKGCLKTAKTTVTKTDSTDTISTSVPSDTAINQSPPCNSSQSVDDSNIKSDNSTNNKDIHENNDSIVTPIAKNDKPEEKTLQSKSSSILESLNKLEQAVEEASASLQNSKKTNESLISHKSNIKIGSKLEQNTLGSDADLDRNTLENALKNQQKILNVEGKTLLPETSEDTSSTKTLPTDDSLNISAMDVEIAFDTESVPLEGKNDIERQQKVIKVDKKLSKGVTDVQSKASAVKRVLNIDGFESSVPKKKRKTSNDKSKDKDLGDSAIADSSMDFMTCKKASSSAKRTTFASEEMNEIESTSKMESSTSSKMKRSSTEKCNLIEKVKEKVTDKKLQDKDVKKKLKKKRELVDIDFFSSQSKKTNKIHQKERKPEKSDTSLEGKIEKTDKDNVQLKTMRKHMISKNIKDKHEAQSDGSVSEKSLRASDNFKNKAASKSVISINSLFESDDEGEPSSDSLSDSEQDTMDSATETLKEIFDNYKPVKVKTVKQLSTENVAAGSSGIASLNKSPAKDRSNEVDVQGLCKKKRVAHNPTYLIQRKSSSINPVRRYPKNAPSIPAPKPQPSSSETNAIQGGKKRIAHVPKPTTKTSAPRPRIPIEYGAKVPQNVRQKNLDKLIDENLRLCATEKEAFEKAIEEERNIYTRSTRRQMYMNLCVNTITKLRTEPTPEFPPQLTPSATAATTATTTGESLKTASRQKMDETNLNEERTYDLLSQYILDEDQLVENGYPRPCSSAPGKVTFKSRRKATTPSKDPNKRICCRCGRPYSVREDGTHVRQEECVYHVGRLFRRRTAGDITSSFQCCGGDASTPGCAVCKFHVSEGKNATDGFMTTIISPLAGRQKKVFGLDCEMCYTIGGLELTRVTVVDWKLDKIYDTFVKPDNPILDYNTRFSGVTQECLRGVKTSIREVQAVLLSMISKDSILVGHSLESDLLALKLVHSTVVDTSVVFPHRLGPPYKRALRTLMAEFLKKIIQNSESGHDSYEDAAASLELMLHKVKEDLKKKKSHKIGVIS